MLNKSMDIVNYNRTTSELSNAPFDLFDTN